MRKILIPILWLAIWLAGAAHATEGTAPRQLVVVELFTSQGCSSCPPADALMGDLAAFDDVLPLALHVDYWDYIGWADTFARPENTARQKAYAHYARSSSIYTPQMVVGGTDHVIGFKPMQVVEYLDDHREKIGLVGIDASLEGAALNMRIWPEPGAELPARLLLDVVSFTPEASVEIERGENAGRTISYVNIVRDWQHLARWDGRGELRVAGEVPATGALALIVQSEGPGEILCALRLR